MVTRDPWAVMDGSSRKVDAEDARVAIGALWTPGSTAITARQGLRPGPGNPGLVQATGTPGPNVTVNAFQYALNASRGAGPYIGTETAAVTVPILDVPADPSNQRNDLIIQRQADTYYSDPATLQGPIRVLGTPSGTPVDPSLAAYPDYLLLARVRVTANATTITNSMIDDLRPGWTVGLGGILPVDSLAQRDALTGWSGFTIYRRDRGWHETHDGTAWRVPNGVTVSDLAHITHPVTGQYAVLSTDRIEYRWSGSAWQAVRLVSPAPWIERRLNAATAVAAATNVKIPFDTVIGTAVDITHSAGEFTFARSGRYQLSTSIRVNVLSAVYLWFAKLADPNGNRGKTSVKDGLDLATSTTVRITAGEVWCAWVWSQAPNSLIRENGTTDDWAPYFSANYLGPL